MCSSDLFSESALARKLRSLTPSGRMANSIRDLHAEFPLMGFNKISELVLEIRQQMKKEASVGVGETGNIIGGGLVGSVAGAMAGKGLKGKLVGAAIGGGLGSYAGLAAKRTSPTFEESDPLPIYLQQEHWRGRGV